jgi:Ca2+/H+ antiporter
MPEHAHLYLPEQRSGVGGFAWVTLKFRRTGEVTGALLGAIGVAALMGGMNAISDSALEESNKALTVAVLLVAPVIVVAYLAGPVRKLGDREVLPGIRHVLNATVALPIIAAFFAIGASERVTQKAWLVLLVLAVLLVGVLAISVARSTGDGRRN